LGSVLGEAGIIADALGDKRNVPTDPKDERLSVDTCHEQPEARP